MYLQALPSVTSTALVPRKNLPVTTYAVGLPNNMSSGATGNVNDARNVNLSGIGQSVGSGRNSLLPVCAPNQNVLVNSQTCHEMSKISEHLNSVKLCNRCVNR